MPPNCKSKTLNRFRGTIFTSFGASIASCVSGLAAIIAPAINAVGNDSRRTHILRRTRETILAEKPSSSTGSDLNNVSSFRSSLSFSLSAILMICNDRDGNKHHDRYPHVFVHYELQYLFIKLSCFSSFRCTSSGDWMQSLGAYYGLQENKEKSNTCSLTPPPFVNFL